MAAAERARRAGLNRRLRQAFVEGVEADSRRRLGPGLTAEELGRALRRYPRYVVEERGCWGLHESSEPRG
jgi:hypothetical protein